MSYYYVSLAAHQLDRAAWMARRSHSSQAGKKPCSDRGVRKILARYTQAAGVIASSSRTGSAGFLLTWLKMTGQSVTDPGLPERASRR